MFDRDAVADWLIRRISEVLEVPAETVAPDTPFMQIGLSSVQAVELTDDLQRWTGLTIPPTFAYDYPTIAEAAAFVAAEAAGAAPEAAPAAERPAVSAGEPVAIVGMGCRMPGGGGLEGYWKTLLEGVDAISEVPADRWDAAALYDPDPAVPGKMNTRWGGFVDGVTDFDNEFFGLTAREAGRMDPQQRMVLEVAWEALEDAGIAPAGLAESATGVFMGASTYDHGAALLSSGAESEPYDGTGGALSVVANRLSYCLNLRGPSMAVDTACSSSLVAVHLACQALRNGEADLAIAGGVNVITSPKIALSFSKGGLMAPDGRCKTFDHRADGYVRSEGVGAVVLKPLSRALADGDRIYALVRGGAVNQDGRTNGLAAPNRLAQEAVLRAAYAAAGVDPAEVDYVEAHGTGTAVGDPIEVGALGTVLGAGRPADRPLRVGSAKSNVGHLEAAAGVAGLIKTALALYHRTLPPSLHFQRPNPMLGLDRLPVAVQTEAAAWPGRAGGAPLAGVSSFGFGGTNSHVVLAAGPEPAAGAAVSAAAETAAGARGAEPEAPVRSHLVPVSARTEAALARRAAAWARLARANADDPSWLPRAAAAAALRGDHDRHRAAVVAADAAELAAGMDALAAGERAADVCGPNTVSRRARRPVLVFPGQGSQWEGMGRLLAASVPAFRAAIRRCDAEIARWLGRSLWSDDTGLVAKGTAEVQPALFAIEVALARTWLAWGLAPAAVVGHSMGEIAAAHVSGALSLTDAARIVVERSGLLTELSGKGGLALVELDLDEAEAMVRGREHELAVAALNGPRATVLSGDPQALDGVIADLEGRGVFARRITVEFAAHSPQVEPLQPRLRAALRGIAPGPAETELYSTVTGEPVDGRELGPEYWERNVRATVRFAPALERVLADGHDTFIEVAPHPVLIRSVTETAGASGGADVAVVSSVRRDEDEARGMLRALGELYTVGVAVDWTALYGGTAEHVDLPPHGWDHRRFPLLRPTGTPAGLPGAGGAGAAADGLLGPRIPVGADPALRLWGLPLDLASAPELADHVVDDIPVVPGAYWLSAAAQAAAAAAPGGPVLLEEVAFVQPCPLVGERDPGLQLALRPSDEGGDTLLITSFRAGAPVVHARGVLGAAGGAPEHPPLAELRAACSAPESVDALYERLGGTGLHYGPRFRGLAELWAGSGQALGRIALPDGLGAGAPPLHPALLDACFHTVAAAVGERQGELPLPSGAEHVWSRQDAAPLRAGWVHARVVAARGRDVDTEVAVFDDAGTPVWSARRLRVTMAARRRAAEEGRLYQVRWQPVEPPRPAAGAGAWLLLADRGGAARALADLLARAGDRSLVAVPGAPAAPDERSLEEAGYAGLLAEAAALGAPLRGAVDLRALPASGAEPAGEAALDEAALRRHAAEALELTRALAEAARAGRAPRLWLATSGAQTAFGGSGGAGLPGAALWGLGRVVANEHPETGCTVVDLDRPVRRGDLEAFAALLRAEDPPAQVVLRDGAFAPRLAPLPSAAAAAEAPVRADRTYLLTGGLGALGLQTARWLVERGARHLLLLGRSAPSEQARAAVAELAADGARVRVEQADIADAAALGAVLSGLGTDSPDLGGVFHLAGVLEDTLVADLGGDGLRRAMAGKALGAWNLHTLTRGRPVEHFVLFSSMAAVLGSPGQGAYAAANAFLAALAGERAALGLPALCVDWGPWGGSGLAVSAGGVDRLAARGVPPLTGEVAFELLDEAMRGGAPNVVAAAFNWADISRTGALPSVRLLLGDLLPADGAAAALRGSARAAVLALETHERRAEALRGFLLEQVASVLGAPAARLDSGVPFQELGFDSLMAVELRNRLESALEVRLSATMVFAHPTVDDLTAGLLDRLAPDITAAAAQGPGAAAEDGPGDDADGLAELDDDQLSALLAEELGVLDTMEEQ